MVFFLLLLCTISAAGVLPRLIAWAGLAVLVIGPVILLATFFWRQELVDRLEGSLLELSTQANHRIGNRRQKTHDTVRN